MTLKETHQESHDAHIEAVRRGGHWIRVAVTVLAVGFAVTSLSGIVFVLLSSRTRDQACEVAADNREGLRYAIATEAPKLGYVYDRESQSLRYTGEVFAYFVEHPDERATLLRRLRMALSWWPPVDCSQGNPSEKGATP